MQVEDSVLWFGKLDAMLFGSPEMISAIEPSQEGCTPLT